MAAAILYDAREHLARAEGITLRVAREVAEQEGLSGPEFSVATAWHNRLLAVAHAHISLAQAINANKLANPEPGGFRPC